MPYNCYINLFHIGICCCRNSSLHQETLTFNFWKTPAARIWRPVKFAGQPSCLTHGVFQKLSLRVSKNSLKCFLRSTCHITQIKLQFKVKLFYCLGSYHCIVQSMGRTVSHFGINNWKWTVNSYGWNFLTKLPQNLQGQSKLFIKKIFQLDFSQVKKFLPILFIIHYSLRDIA